MDSNAAHRMHRQHSSRHSSTRPSHPQGWLVGQRLEVGVAVVHQLQQRLGVRVGSAGDQGGLEGEGRRRLVGGGGSGMEGHRRVVAWGICC